WVGVVSPVLFSSRTFGSDWLLHLRLIYDQQRAIEADGVPSLFSHFQQVGAFYPTFAFLGGTLYALAGYLAVVVGALKAYAILHIAFVAAALAGWCWLARQVGVKGWRAPAPGVVYPPTAL